MATSSRSLLTDAETQLAAWLRQHPTATFTEVWRAAMPIIEASTGAMTGGEALMTAGQLAMFIGTEATLGDVPRGVIPGEPRTCPHCGAYDIHPHYDHCLFAPPQDADMAWDDETDDGMPA